MPADVRIPTLGESVNEGVIVRWIRADGESVKVDEPLLELETDKASVEIPAESAGVLRVLKPEGETVQVGDVVGRIENGAGQAQGADTKAKSAESAPPGPATTKPDAQPKAQAGDNGEAGAEGQPAGPLSPAVRRLVEEHSLDPKQIPASGKGGRLTKGDVLSHLESGTTPVPSDRAAARTAPVVSSEKDAATARSEASGAAAAPPPPTAAPENRPVALRPAQPPRTPGTDSERVPMTRLRQRIAERLLQAQQAGAILTTFNEVDMTAAMELRTRYKDRFKQIHGVGLGFMSFFSRACIQALKELPLVNARIDGTDIVYQHNVNLGVAVSTERGLIVPILHRADQLSFAQIETEIARLAELARQNKLSVDDLSGGTFSISNGGIFGSLMSTPILNPPQSAILGMHKIEKRPVVVNDQIVIRPMMYLALSYDHRLIDGEQAVTFLVRVKERLEDPGRLLLEV